MVILKVWKNLALVSLSIAMVCLGGCTKKPTDNELELLRKKTSDSEALLQAVRNAEIVAQKVKNNQEREWNFVIQGQTATGKTETLTWKQLQELATVNINTVDASNIVTPKKVFKVTGINVNSLLQKFAIQSGVTEITFVCYDADQVTMKIYSSTQLF
ncbi:hypothetical protein IQ237_13570 [Sphaerospermopsis sp. LEGE 08334]|nr:hypothetical protein [Sphaerospermopsis sp. LEGE 08334]